MTEASPTKPPFHVTSWGESTSNNLSINQIETTLGRIYRQLTIHFEIHNTEEHSALNRAIQEAHFQWLLPMFDTEGKMGYVVYKGLTHECEIKQEGRADSLEAENANICVGTLQAVVFESYPA